MLPASLMWDLPFELVLYILHHFLTLPDLWQLAQVSRRWRGIAIDTMLKRWRIEIVGTPNATMKMQCRGALIALEMMANELAPLDSVPAYTPFFLPSSPDISLPFPEPSASSSSSSTSSREPTSWLTPRGLLHFLPALSLVEDKASLSSSSSAMDLDVLQREERLHKRVIKGLGSYKHRYVLIEDIDIRNRIRTAVDVVFHHVVFVLSLARPGNRHPPSRAMAAMVVRFLSRIDAAFPSYCREIAYTLADNVKAFSEYTGYRLLALRRPSVRCREAQTRAMTQVIHSMFACFELVGAAFTGKILNESNVENIVQRISEVLSDESMRNVKRELLMDMLDMLQNDTPNLAAGDLCRLVRQEIGKCDRPRSHRPTQPPTRPSLAATRIYYSSRTEA